MAIHRGIQSAIFFYLSCTPCLEARHKKTRKQEVERGRIEREAMAAEMPNMYRQASPTSTNPHWQTEVDAGPHMEPRGKKRTNNSDGRRRARTDATVRSNGSNRPSSIDLSSSGGSRDGRVDSKVDFKQYQRDDEHMWGSSSIERIGSNGSWSSNGVTRPQKAHVRLPDTATSYARYRAPLVNDLHPATVTKLHSQNEARWIFQPLPTADIMSGKQQAARSRSDSGRSSRRSAKSAAPSSRDIDQRLLERRIKHSESAFAPSTSRESSSLTATDQKAPQSDGYGTSERDFADVDGALTNSEKRTTSFDQQQVSEESAESEATVVRRPAMAPEPLRRQQARTLASRPQLSTIVSDSVVPSDASSELLTAPPRPKENTFPNGRYSDNSTDERDRISRRSPLHTTDESLKVLRELAPSSAIFNTKVFSSDDLTRASKKSSRHPSHDASDERKLDIDPQLFEAWHTTDFALPEWIHEHTKREVKERWSMDI